jgi:hypothetical protein
VPALTPSTDAAVQLADLPRARTARRLHIPTSMLRLALLLTLIAGCTGGAIGAPCTRHSDCTTNYCAATGACAVATIDAGTTPDDGNMSIPPLDDGGVDAPDQ